MAEEISVLVNDTQETVSANITNTSSYGDVSKSGTPLVNQIALWLNSTTIKGEPLFTYDGTTLYIGDPAFGETKIEITEDKLKVYKDAFSGFTELLYDSFKLTNQDAGVYNLKTGSDAGNTHNVKFPDSGVDVKTLAVSVNGEFADDAGDVTISTGISNIVEDTTPQLGGELDLNGHSVGGSAQTATGDGTTTIDWKLGNFFHFQFGAFNETFTFTAPTKPGTFILKMVQDSVGSRTATWPATAKWIGGTAPTLTTTATTGTDIITFYFDGTNYFGVEALNFS